MKLGIILLATWMLIYAFKKLGMKQISCGLVSGLASSIIVNGIFFLLGEPGVYVILSLIGFTAMAALFGFFTSRKIYGLTW